MVWCITCLAEGSRKSPASSVKSNRQDMSTLQQARLPTLSWRRREHCLGFLWQLYTGKRPPALQASLVPCAQLRSTRFPHSFRFPSASSSRHLSSSESLSNCPNLEQVAFFCHLFYVSLIFSVSGPVLLCLGYVQLWSLLVLLSHSFRRLPFFICIFVLKLQQLFLFLVFFFFFYFFFCVYVVVVPFCQRKGLRLTSCYWQILFKHIHSIKIKKNANFLFFQSLGWFRVKPKHQK